MARAWAWAGAGAWAWAGAGAWAWAGAGAWAWAGARAGARAWAGGARARARARAGARAGSWAGAGAGRMDYLDWLMLIDQATEEGESVFELLTEGACVLLECSQRWYIGRVVRRGSVTVLLEDVAAVGQIGDLGQFLAGIITDDTDISPLPRPREIHLIDVQGVDSLTPAILKKLRRRTHTARPERSNLPKE